MKNRFDDLYINIGCGSHPIDGWKNYDYNKFIFLAKIKPLYIFLNISDLYHLDIKDLWN
tara:strand:+ start:654 stop:830 length:177 start_codon:yes stop_codon:yes gene_type:complete